MAIIDNTSKQQTLQQKRAAFALNEISKIAEKTMERFPQSLLVSLSGCQQ